jgi:transposase-like protein
LRSSSVERAGLSATTIGRLLKQWQAEREHFMRRDLLRREYVYVWMDRIHTNVRLGADDRLCCLVVIGAQLDNVKELVALQDGSRESSESWAELASDLKRRGMHAPVLALGDGALGFWAAARTSSPSALAKRLGS